MLRSIVPCCLIIASSFSIRAEAQATPAQAARPQAASPQTPTERSTAQAVMESFRLYGTLRPSVAFSSSAVESFSNPNASAITAAANPVLATMPDEGRLTFQAAQTRFGVWVNEKGIVRGHLEFDFYDAARASPTVQALPRLRIAAVEWAPTSKLVLAAGQDWDLHAPINPYGVNLVGAHFQAGNTAFMRHQVKALYKPAERTELAIALGLQGANATAKDAAFELAQVPTFALRLTHAFAGQSKLGLSALATRLRFTPGVDERHALSGAVSLFGELAPYEALRVRFESYLGQNLANLGTLALATGSRATDVAEAGAFISARHQLGAQHALYGTYGYAGALQPSKIVPSYAYAAGAGDAPAFSAAALAGTGAGMRWNQAARIGYEFKPVKMLALVVEGYWYRTRHTLLALDVARTDSSIREAFGSELASVLSF